MNLRATAVHILENIIQHHHSLSDSLAKELPKIKDPRDRAFIQALCFGVCRSYFQLDATAQTLLNKPLKAKDIDVYLLMLVGLFQLTEMRLPDYAAISETVAATALLKKPWAKNVVNAVLRNFQRTPRIAAAADDWLVSKIKQQWPDDWQTIMQSFQHPPLSLRVNQRKMSRQAYIKKYAAEELHIIPETQAGIYLTIPKDVEEIPGFMAGEVSVQDGAAQLAAELLQLQPGQRVLDACAAPGGKASHILEIVNDIDLLAIDHDAERLISIEENFQRLQLTATCIAADAANPDQWWDKKLFDRILLDAPCSATGVIRRHPDIRLLRRETDIAKLAVEQSRLLNALWPLLKQGGLLIYATCSIFSEENTEVMGAFLQSHPDAREEKIAAGWGISCEIGRQILPGQHGMDGFYYAGLRK